MDLHIRGEGALRAHWALGMLSGPCSLGGAHWGREARLRRVRLWAQPHGMAERGVPAARTSPGKVFEAQNLLPRLRSNQNLYFNKIARYFVCIFKSDRF